MKFKLLSIGQKFEYDGVVYVKTSPLVASNIETGHNKMIPRYAMLTLLDNSNEKKQISDKQVSSNEVLTAFNNFYEKCIKTLENKNALIPEIKDEMDKARDEFSQHFT